AFDPAGKLMVVTGGGKLQSFRLGTAGLPTPVAMTTFATGGGCAAGIAFVPASAGFVVSPTFGLVTTEAGGTAQFSMRLNTQPTADVTVTLASSNPSEGTVAPGTLTFTPDDWGEPQVVTVTGAADVLVDGDVPYTIVTNAAVSADPTYDGL